MGLGPEPVSRKVGVWCRIHESERDLNVPIAKNDTKLSEISLDYSGICYWAFTAIMLNRYGKKAVMFSFLNTKDPH